MYAIRSYYATHNPKLQRGLNVMTKAERVAHYHKTLLTVWDGIGEFDLSSMKDWIGRIGLKRKYGKDTIGQN